MTISKIPINGILYKNIDNKILQNDYSLELYDGYLNEFKQKTKRAGLLNLCNLSENNNIDGLYWWENKNIAIANCDGSIFKITDSVGSFTNITGDKLEA
jgi:hypothetical protein